MAKAPKTVFDPGKSFFAWEAADYHPHERGWVWMSVFCGIILFASLWAIWTDPKWGWISAMTFFFVAGMYFYTHRSGDQVQQVHLCQNGIVIDGTKFHPWEKFSGYWFAYDPGVSVIYFELAQKSATLKLQMGHLTPDVFRGVFANADFPEIPNKQETLLEVWIRILKL